MTNPKQPKILIATATWWPLSAQLALSLLKHGCELEAVCPPGHPLRCIGRIDRFHKFRRRRSLQDLEKAILAAAPDFIVPCDDFIIWQLHQLYLDQPRLREIIARSLGDAAHFEDVRSRVQLQRIAQDLSIRVPRTALVKSADDLAGWFSNAGDIAVIKRDGTNGGNGVRIVGSLSEAVREAATFSRPDGRAFTWKRMLVDRDPVALWSSQCKQEQLVSIQEFIPGRPANLMAACWKGEVLGTVAVEVVWSQGLTGAALVVRLVENDEMKRAAILLSKALGLSGFFGLDFVIGADSGAPYLIELNPRCTQLGHLPVAGMGDLAGRLCEKLGACASENCRRSYERGLSAGSTIAFFPRSYSWSRKHQLGGDWFEDIPANEPKLMKEMLKGNWPNRQWPARLYHWLRPPTEQPPTRL